MRRPPPSSRSLPPARWRLALLALALVATGCYPKDLADVPHSLQPSVQVLEVRQTAVDDRVRLLGRIEPWREATLYFEVVGVVAEVLVEEGQQVEPGDPVARLVPDDFQLSLAQAQADLGAAQAELDLLQAGTRKEDLEAARADFDRAEVLVTFWVGEMQRAQTLFDKSTIAASDYERTRREHEAAAQEQRRTKAQLDRAIAGPRKEEIAAAVAKVEARRQAAGLAARQLEKATIKAPFGGRVEQRLLDPGAYVNIFPMGGVPVVHLVDLDQVDAVIAVPEANLEQFPPGSPIEVASAVRPDHRAETVIKSVGRVADRASGTYQVRARIANGDGWFTSGMVVTANVAGGQPRRALHVPVTAVRHAYGQQPYVLVVHANSHEVDSRTVRLGPVSADQVEVNDGLAAGDLVIVRGHFQVVRGDRVRYQRWDSDAVPVASKQ